MFFDVAGAEMSAATIAEGLAGHGVRIGPMGETTLRAVTNLDVDRAMIEEAAGALRAVVTGA